tara:strand:- start:841 stop:2721 length:1881 start_codon:yes stop_codon:yes gene_type:complete
MSSICGIWSKKNSLDTTKRIKQMIDKLNYWGADKTDYKETSTVAFGHLMLFNSHESLHETTPLFNSSKTVLLTADLRLDYREELKEKLGLAQQQLYSDTDLLLKAYQKWDTKCVNHLFGDFVFALYDGEKEEIFCGRDQVGIKSMYYYNDESLFAFSSELKALIEIEEIKTTLNSSWLNDYLAHVISDKSSTAYHNIFKLPSAHTLIVSKQEHSTTKYWSLEETVKPNYKSDEEWLTALKITFENSVLERSRSAYPLGAELSSGIDSSSIVAIARKARNDLHTFTNVMDEKNKSSVNPFDDERKDVEKIVEYCNLNHQHFLTGIDLAVSKRIQEVGKIIDYPPITFNGIFSDAIHKAANNVNVRTILSGAGGDEISTVRGKGLKEELLHHRKFKALFTQFKKEYKSRATKKFLSFLIRQLTPINSFSLSKKPLGYYRLNLIDNKIVSHKRLRSIIKQNKQKLLPKSIKEYQLMRLNHPRFNASYENQEILARANKIEYRYPMLDLKLLQLAFHMPQQLTIKENVNRFAFRTMIGEILPKEIVWNLTKKRIFNVPSVYQRIDKDRNELLKMLDSIDINSEKNKWFRIKKSKKIISEFRTDLQHISNLQLNSILYFLILVQFLKRENI